MTTRVVSSALVATVVALLLASGGGAGAIKEGGTFLVGVRIGAVDTIDPALVDFPPEQQLLLPACATLMAYPNKTPPEGLRLRPDLAEAEPVVSKDGRTYTFTIRRDARFSTGARVTARDVAHTIARFLDPKLEPVNASLYAAIIVGGEDVLAGRTTKLRGVVAQGRKLTLRLTRRVANPLGLTTGWCIVPASLSNDPEGAKAPLPSPAPYYVAEYVPNERIVLERNRFYRGQRPQHVERIVGDFVVDGGAIVDAIASGQVDFGVGSNPWLRERTGELRRRYGVNKSQFWVVPGDGHRMFVLNTSRPLFRNNPKLRQAVNFAVDRRALTRELGVLAGIPTDQYLRPVDSGYKDARIYPLEGPDLRRARTLAKGNLRSGKAVLYTGADFIEAAISQLLQQSLRKIGLEVQIKAFPSLLFEKMATERDKFDIGRIVWFPAPDASWFSDIFDGRSIGRADNINWSYFNSPKYNRRFDQALRLTGVERERAYGELDVQLSRDAAPAIPIVNITIPSFVSARVGCIVLKPWLDLTAVCLK